MKKVLVIHNTYRNSGGEDVAVNNEIALLERHYQVESIFFTNQNIDFFSLVGFISSSNYKTNRILKKKLNKFNPDIVYVHNTWFNASLGIFKVLKKRKIKTVIKLHNFRYRCTNTFFSSTHIGEDSHCFSCGLTKKDVGVFNKYFINSYLKSLFIILYGKRYFKILGDSFYKVFVLTIFHKKYIDTLLPQSNIETFPNYIDIQDSHNSKSRQKYFLYAGRISEEKGVTSLIEAFLEARFSDFKLKIIGDGPQLKYLSKQNFENVEFLGLQTNQDTLNLISKSYCVVTATRLWEGQPTLLCEASALGVPSIYPDFGGMPEFFPNKYELSFKQYDYEDLTSKLIMATEVIMNEKLGSLNKEYLNNLLIEEDLINVFQKCINE